MNSEITTDVKNYMIDRLNDGVGTGEASDLHHHLLNEDYFIIGRFSAKEWLGDEAFEAIEQVKNYEQSTFGEVNTDFSEPERVANMIAYIVGEELLHESDTLSELWDDTLTEQHLQDIAAELEALAV